MGIKARIKEVSQFKANHPKQAAFSFLDKLPNQSDITPLKYEFLKIIFAKNFSIDNELQSSLFIPAGRSYFSVVDINPYSEINETISDYFFKSFAAQYKSTLQRMELFHSFKDDTSEPKDDDKLKVEIPKGIVDGEYIFDIEKRKGYIAHKNGLVCELKHASSGEQEFLPLFLSLLEITNKNFIVEEPEAHLFPKSQREVTKFLLSRRKAAGDVFITTHSPYILASFNNLLYAGIINEKLAPKKRKKLEELIPAPCLVKENSLAAYYVDNGTAKDIIDPETKLIMADVIDEVSDDIDTEFDKIAELGL